MNPDKLGGERMFGFEEETSTKMSKKEAIERVLKGRETNRVIRYERERVG